MDFLGRRSSQNLASLPIHRLQREAVRNIADQRRSHEAQCSVERDEVFRCVFLFVQLAADDACEVAEAVYAEDEGPFPGF